MSLDTAYKQFTAAAEEAEMWLQGEIAGLRSGRVKPHVLETLAVEHYGARTPLQGLASISVSDARTLVVSPWDPSALASIEKAIIAAQLGAQPVVDGKILRLNFPMLSEEMREQTVKQLHKKAEDARVRLRKSRDESLSLLKNEKENSVITEDDFYEGKEGLNHRINQYNERIAALVTKKEEELRTI